MGSKMRADEYPQGAGRICNAPSSRTAALGIGPYIFYRRFSDFHTPQVQSKALVDGESREPSERFSGRLFLFFAVRHGSFLSPNRERKEWGRKTPLALHFPPCVLQ